MTLSTTNPKSRGRPKGAPNKKGAFYPLKKKLEELETKEKNEHTVVHVVNVRKTNKNLKKIGEVLPIKETESKVKKLEAIKNYKDNIGTENIKLIREKLIEMALAGDTKAAMYLDKRCNPEISGNFIKIRLPEINTLSDVSRALGIVIDELSNGNITDEAAKILSSLLDLKYKFTENMLIQELNKRLENLEGSIIVT